MKSRIPACLVTLLPLLFTGCGVAHSLTTKHLDFEQNIIPSLNGGAVCQSISDTRGPIGPLPFEIQINGDVRSKFDQYNGGVDSAYFTYTVSNEGSAPVRIRLWTIVATGSPAFQDNAALLLEIAVPAGATVTVDKSTAARSEALRSTAESILRNGSVRANLYFEADRSDRGGRVTVTQLTVAGRAHGSLF